MILGAFTLLSISAAAFIVAATSLSARADHPLHHRCDDHTDTLGFSGKGLIQHGEGG